MADVRCTKPLRSRQSPRDVVQQWLDRQFVCSAVVYGSLAVRYGVTQRDADERIAHLIHAERCGALPQAGVIEPSAERREDWMRAQRNGARARRKHF